MAWGLELKEIFDSRGEGPGIIILGMTFQEFVQETWSRVQVDGFGLASGVEGLEIRTYGRSVR